MSNRIARLLVTLIFLLGNGSWLIARGAEAPQKNDTESFVELMGQHDLSLLDVGYHLAFPLGRSSTDLSELAVAKVLARMRASAESGALVRRLSPVYETHFSKNEIRDLLEFLHSPLGNKFLSAHPRVLQGVGTASVLWANELIAEMGPSFQHFARGVFFYERRDLDRALHAFRRADELYGNDPDIHYALGRAHADRKEYQDAAREFRKSIELDNSRAEFHTSLGVALYNLGELPQAIDSYQRARGLNGQDWFILENLGDAFIAAGRFSEAIEAYHGAAKLVPASAEVHAALGDSLVGDFDAAIAALQAFLERDPSNAWGYLNLGIAFANANRIKPSIDAFRRSAEIQPEYAVAHFQLGNALARNGNHETAILSHRKAIELSPIFAESHVGLGRALASLGRLDEASVAFETAIQTADEEWIVAWAYSRLADVLVRQKRAQEAIKALRISISLNANFFGYHEALGDALLGEGALDEAVVSYRRAVELRPNLAEPHYKLAVALERAGRSADAQIEFQEAKRLGYKE